MPNWCDTHYTIRCNAETKKVILDAIRKVEICNNGDEHTVEEFEKLKAQGLSIEEIYQNLIKGGMRYCYNVGLYYVLLELGYSEKFLTDFHENIRGYITDYDEGVDDISIYCDTAWSESAGFRHLLLDKFHDDDSKLKIYFTAEEPGCEYYLTNDPDYSDIYCVDIENDGVEYEEENDVIALVNDRFSAHCITIEDALKLADTHNDTTKNDDHIWIHKFEYCED